MLGLAIHTSSPELGLALAGPDINRHQIWPIGRDLAAHLQTCLMEFLGDRPWTDVSYLAVAIGPGGFTGTRIGVVAARTLAQQLEIPLFGISSLAAVAEQQRQDRLTSGQPLQHFAVEMAAQRGDCFGAIYAPTENGLEAQLPDQVFAKSDWEQTLSDWPHPYQHLVAAGGLAFTTPQILALAERAWTAGQRPHWSETLPFYGQHPVEG